MADITWPAELPQKFLAEGYSRAAANNLLRSSADIGPGKTRRRSSAGPQPLSGNLSMKSAQLETFKAFFKNDLKDGALRFNWIDPDDGVTPVEMRFTREPSWVKSSVSRWVVSMQLEILP